MRKEILTKLSKNEITVEEAEKKLDNYDKLQQYLSGLDEYGDNWCPVSDPNIVYAMLEDPYFGLDKENIDMVKLDSALTHYRGKYTSVEAFAKEYWGRLLNQNAQPYVANFKNKYKSDVTNWIKEVLESGKLHVITLGKDVYIFLKRY